MRTLPSDPILEKVILPLLFYNYSIHYPKLVNCGIA